MKDFDRFYLYRNRLVTPYLLRLLAIIDTVTTLGSLFFLAALVYQYGYPLTEASSATIYLIYRVVWVLFLLNISLHGLFKGLYEPTVRNELSQLLYGLLYLTLIPIIFHEPHEAGAIHAFWALLSHPLYMKLLLLLLAFLQLSKALFQLLGKRTNPSFIFASSFLVILLLGTGLLLLPHATYGGISFVDALFTATSATCVTGLTTVDVPTTFTPMGQLIIILLIQLGGLGVMTFTCFFALFFMGNSSVYSQLMVRDLVSPQSIGSLFSTLGYILGFTLVIEACGALLIFLAIHGTFSQMDLEAELLFSLFHSISAFCNAGFSNLPDGMGHPLLMQGHNLLYLVLSLLIILGGLGYPVLVNLAQTVWHEWRRFLFRYLNPDQRPKRKVKLYSLNTRITLVMTLSLLLLGSLLVGLFEWHHSFAHLPLVDRCVQAFFTATSPRTAGFASFNPAQFTLQTLLIIMVFMMIGGGNQSTAGGIKVNVFAVVALNLRTLILGGSRANIFGRELPSETIRRSNAALLMYLILSFIGLFLLTLFEPHITLHALFFEVISALSTVGLTLNVTPLLTTPSKVVVVGLMFIGRVGAFTLLSSLLKMKQKSLFSYPQEAIIIN
ncbi:MAG: potassium transporter TrkG [Phocaeicola sp.]